MEKHNTSKRETALNSLGGFILRKLHKHTLYHYTTLSTFDAFLKDDAHLYCTHYAALNDSSELRCGLDVVCKHLQKENGISFAVCSQLKECFEEGCSREMIHPTWIMSFSLEKDSLYQWGMYTDRKQGGYSIGFDSAKLMNFVEESNERNGRTGNPTFTMKLMPCFYVKRNRKQIKTFLRQVFDINDSSLARLKKSGFKSASAVVSVLARMVLVSCLIKHESFKFENEVRLVIDPTSFDWTNVSLVGGKPRWNTGLFPHGKEQLRSVFKEVWISPHGDKQLLKNVAEIMKQKHGLTFTIKASKSPYNGR